MLFRSAAAITPLALVMVQGALGAAFWLRGEGALALVVVFAQGILTLVLQHVRLRAGPLPQSPSEASPLAPQRCRHADKAIWYVQILDVLLLSGDVILLGWFGQGAEWSAYVSAVRLAAVVAAHAPEIDDDLAQLTWKRIASGTLASRRTSPNRGGEKRRNDSQALASVAWVRSPSRSLAAMLTTTPSSVGGRSPRTTFKIG